MEVSIKSLTNALTLKPINDDEDMFAQVMSGFLEEVKIFRIDCYETET